MTVEQTVLPNGLTVITDHMNTVETVSLGVWVRVGARYEPAALNGVSHMLEHMAFKGTARRSARQIAEEIEAVGGHLNAYTSSEMTAYHATVIKDDVALAVDIIADILQNSAFDEDELARERDVILQEIGHAQDTPEDILFEAFQAEAFPDQPLGRTILGPPDIVSSLQRTDLAAYMGRHYSAPRMILAAAGNLDHAMLAELAAEKFADLPGGEAETPDRALYRGGEAHLPRPLEQVHLVVGFEGPSATSDWRYAAGVASMIVGGGMSSRLFQEVRETLGLAYSVYSFTSFYEDSGLFGVYAGTGPEQIHSLIDSICASLRAASLSIKPDELKRAKAQFRAGALMSLESTSARAERLARDIAVHGRHIPLETVMAEIEAIDEAAVEAALSRILEATPSVAAVGPMKDASALQQVRQSLVRAA